MKYVVFGLGGVGGAVADQLVLGQRDVTAIAHGVHLEACKQQGGLRVIAEDGAERVAKLPVMVAQDYEGTPDVVFVCVKDYSLDSVYPFLERVCAPDTTVIPLSNVYGTGTRMAERLASSMGEAAPLVTCGCIYCSATIKEPGLLVKDSPLCRVVCGMPSMVDHKDNLARFMKIAEDATVAGLKFSVSNDIRRDHLRKFSYMASASAVGIIFGCTADDIKMIPLVRKAFQDAIREIVYIAAAQNIALGDDIMAVNEEILMDAAPGATTSLQRDLAAGHPSEIEGIIRSVVAWGIANNVATPVFKRASVAAREQYGV